MDRLFLEIIFMEVVRDYFKEILKDTQCYNRGLSKECFCSKDGYILVIFF